MLILPCILRDVLCGTPCSVCVKSDIMRKIVTKIIINFYQNNMGKKLFLLLACMFMTASMAFAQKQVQGTVTDSETGEPIVGAAVKVTDTTIGTLTDVDGKFTLKNVPSSAKTLTVSFMGMKTEEVQVRNNVAVTMLDESKSLGEVMVVAFGTSTKQAFTGSAAVMDAKDLEKHVTTNVANALVGNVPGLQMRGASGAPGASAGAMNIRGISSMYANTEPLIIVDGAPYSASLTNIPQSDIESVTVLKDAASAALYGARAANGVILVTTKKGKANSAEISVDARWGTNSRAVQDYDVIKNPAQYYETYYGQLFNNYYYQGGQSLADANAAANTQLLNHLGYNIFSYPDGQQLIGTNGKLNPNATLGRKYSYGGTDYYLLPDDWQDAAYSNALRQEYNVNIKGGHDRGNYYASFGYLDEGGIIQYSDYERISARFKGDYRVKKWLKMSGNVGYTNSTKNGTPGFGGSSSSSLMYYTSMMAPIYPLYVRTLDANGNPVIATDQYGHQMYDYGTNTDVYNGYGNLKRPFLNTGNPLGSNRYNQNLDKVGKLNGSYDVEINFTDWLKFNYTTTVDWGHTNSTFVESPYEGAKKGVNGEVNKEQTDALRTDNVQTLAFAKQFGKHDVNAQLGHEYYRTRTNYLGATGQGMFSPEIPELNACANVQYDSQSYTSGYSNEGYFANAQYNYDQKYFASATFRREASSYFHPDNRWGNFWSGGVAWLLNKESFLSSQTWIDMLKLKLSVGQTGNDNIGNWAYVDLYSLTPSGTYTMAPSFARLGNKDITWETTTSTNLGVEFSFWNGRLTGGVDFYNKKTTDQLFWLSIPETMGTRGYYGNMGDARNYGVEIELAGDIVRTKDITWNVQGNIAYNKNKITALPSAKFVDEAHGVCGFSESDDSQTISHWFEAGGSMYNAFLPKYAGVNEKGESLFWVDDELGGKTDRPGKNLSSTTTDFQSATKYDCGSMLPKLFGGFGTTLNAKGFDLSATFDYQIGGKVFDYRYASLMSSITSASNGGSSFHKDILKSWTPNNTNSNIPRFMYGDKYTGAKSDRFLTSASYLNFQSITLGYTLPKQLIEPLGLTKLRVYFAGENLCFWSARKGMDPRYSYSSLSYQNVYSPVRTLMGGIQITF